MRNYFALGVGMLMLALALFVAAGKTTQDDAARPEVAQQLATRLHETPTITMTPSVTPTFTATPLPSSTPVATVTPVPGWTKLSTRDVELWLPPGYQLLEIDEHVQIVMYFSRADLVGILKFQAYDAATGFDWLRSVRVFQVKTGLRPDEVPYGIDVSSRITEPPVPVSLGRYSGYRAMDDKLRLAGSHYTDLLYWIPRGEYYYLVIFSTWAEYGKLDSSIFEQSMRTLTLLSDE